VVDLDKGLWHFSRSLGKLGIGEGPAPVAPERLAELRRLAEEVVAAAPRWPQYIPEKDSAVCSLVVWVVGSARPETVVRRALPDATQRQQPPADAPDLLIGRILSLHSSGLNAPASR
jgi:hypothetical protein